MQLRAEQGAVNLETAICLNVPCLSYKASFNRIPLLSFSSGEVQNMLRAALEVAASQRRETKGS